MERKHLRSEFIRVIPKISKQLEPCCVIPIVVEEVYFKASEIQDHN